MRAALAALLWEAGREADAEGEWGFACTAIATGCKKYQDGDWLARIRWGSAASCPAGGAFKQRALRACTCLAPCRLPAASRRRSRLLDCCSFCVLAGAGPL